MWEEVLPYLGDRVGRLVAALPESCLARLEEVRLRAGRPLIVCYGGLEGLVGLRGLCAELSAAYVVTPEDCQAAVQRLTNSSLYALEEELRSGYLTLPGGHRAGFVGRAVVEGGRLKSLRHLSGLNLRLTREVRGAADAVLPQLIDRAQRELCSTLVLSPPQAGKTTLLRDLCRQVSEGRPALGLPGRKVVIVDERSELAGCYEGLPQCDVGPRTDVLDACPKAEGIAMVLRAMSPEVIVTDELGRPEDVAAIREAVRTGVTVVASAHAADLREASRRPALAPLLTEGCFARAVTLSRRLGPGTVESVLRLGEAPERPVTATVSRAAGGG